MKSIAIITARGGSKRIPKKNIKIFCGKPIIAYSIEAAISSGLFDEIMVSTDSHEIAEIAKQYGAKIPFLRSEQTSHDFATTSDVLEEVICQYKKMGKEFDTVCCIYPTAVFVTGEKLKKAMNIFETKKASCVTPVVKFSFPPQRAFIIRNEQLAFQFPQYAKTRSQDLEPIYHDCGQFYILKTKDLMEQHTIAPLNTYPFILEETEVQDIDNPSDWEIAEEKYKTLCKNNGNTRD
ncbi:MAG: pseudaminic acid cytidylyltransferase [Neisseriaceae bacterium]|nr:pseudaminic acid cytidylyltransferase [Neisseriaceae bacterium]